MAASPRSWKDTIWLGWFCLQLGPILLVDAVHFYPERLYKPAGSPLHLLQRLRATYLAWCNDPLLQWKRETAGGRHESWIELFLLVEMVFSLPSVLYAVYRLGIRRNVGTTGADELLFLVYAFETAFTTLVCIYDVLWWDEAVYPASVKWTFALSLYGPWFAMPCLMFIDMYERLLARFRIADAGVESKKAQ